MNLLFILLQDVTPESVDFAKGWIVTIAGFLIVIIALFILSSIFRGVAAYFKKKDERKTENGTAQPPTKRSGLKQKTENEQLSVLPSKPSVSKGEIAPEVLTAIGMALYLSTNLHDEESNVITINRRTTSWNDKRYGVRHWKR